MSNTAEKFETPDFDSIKTKQQASWSSGDYAIVGTTLQIVGEQLCESMNLSAGSKVLDVAAGNGNATLAAARRFCDVTSTDYVAELLEKGRARAQADSLSVCFRHADAENLPFDDGEFTAVLSTFGVMFTPHQEQAAHELVRVCRSGGTIGLANWTPEGFIGQLFKVIGRHIPPAPGLKPPSRWGTKAGIEALFGNQASAISITPRNFNFRYLSVDHFIEVFSNYYGPIHKALTALGENAPQLESDIQALLATMNVATDGTLCVPSAYVDVVLTKR